MGNEVDGRSGRVWNCIDFIAPEGAPAPANPEQLRVQLAARAVSPVRVALAFRLIKARLAMAHAPTHAVARPTHPRNYSARLAQLTRSGAPEQVPLYVARTIVDFC